MRHLNLECFSFVFLSYYTYWAIVTFEKLHTAPCYSWDSLSCFCVYYKVVLKRQLAICW